jgi:hypothetical protein
MIPATTTKWNKDLNFCQQLSLPPNLTFPDI